MREIKFRGKRIDGQGWIYGWLRQTGHQEIQKKNGQYIRTEKYYQIQEKYISQFVEEETIGQYTGLKDKNAKEIYEGDIVKAYYNNKYYITSISYSEEYAQFVTKCNEVIFDNEPLGDIEKADREVIGNIYNNPELLK